MKQRKDARSFLEVAKTVRKDWNGIRPVTRVAGDKKKYSRKQKHRAQED